jgi:hypothetical protein
MPASPIERTRRIIPQDQHLRKLFSARVFEAVAYYPEMAASGGSWLKLDPNGSPFIIGDESALMVTVSIPHPCPCFGISRFCAIICVEDQAPLNV